MRSGPQDEPQAPDVSSAWAGLWPPRKGPDSEPQAVLVRRPAEPSDPPDGAATWTGNGDDPRALESRIADLATMIDSWRGDVMAFRSTLAAAVAEQVEARADTLERETARDAALEARLRSELQGMIAAALARLPRHDCTLCAEPERVDRLEARVRDLAGEVAQLRSQLASTEAQVADASSSAGHRAASDTLPPVPGDLSAVHAEVAAVQQSIGELRRRMPMSLPRLAPMPVVRRPAVGVAADGGLLGDMGP